MSDVGVILEVGIGVVFVFLLLSLVTSTLTEWVAGIFALRSKTLATGIRELLDDPEGKGLAQAIYDHPLIKGLTRDGKLPSYIPSATFAFALLDIIAPATGAPSGQPASASLDELRQAVAGLPEGSLKTAVLALAMALTNAPVPEAAPAPGAATPPGAIGIRSAVERMGNPDVRRAVLALMGQPAPGAEDLLPKLQAWFDDAMDRVSGWYKRTAQLITIGIGLFIVLLLNADTVMIADGLARDPAVRAGVVAAAQQAASKQTQTLDLSTFEKQASQLQLPIGWSGTSGDPRSLPSDVAGWLRKGLGLALTIVAVSMGAPFWFQLLNKLLNLRLSGTPPSPAPDLSTTPAKAKTAGPATG
jgi:hypothetical protein